MAAHPSCLILLLSTPHTFSPSLENDALDQDDDLSLHDPETLYYSSYFGDPTIKLFFFLHNCNFYCYESM